MSNTPLSPANLQLFRTLPEEHDRPSSEPVTVLKKDQGMRTLRDSGLLAIFDGVTAVEEVLRETIDIF